MKRHMHGTAPIFTNRKEVHIKKQFGVAMVLVAMGTTRVRMRVEIVTAGSRMVEMQHGCLKRDRIKKIIIIQTEPK